MTGAVLPAIVSEHRSLGYPDAEDSYANAINEDEVLMQFLHQKGKQNKIHCWWEET